MKRWEFWPHATWFGTCAAVALAAWAPYLIRGQPFRWLQHDGTATIIAGAIQATVTAGAIFATVWQTRKSLVMERARDREALRRARNEKRRHEIEQRLRLHREAVSLVTFAERRLRQLGTMLTGQSKVSTEDRALEASSAVKMHVDALGRFPFERLDRDSAEAFEEAFQLVLAAMSVVSSLRRQIDDNKVLRTSSNPLTMVVFRDFKKELETCASEFNAIAALLDPPRGVLVDSANYVQEQFKAAAE